MIKIHQMWHKDGKIIFQDVAEDWYELSCVTNDLVSDTYGEVLATQIPPPYKLLKD